jgi:decaprenyl-phosphate phosphoribosyltransferase
VVSVSIAQEASSRATWRGHLQIARLDHWVKNAFVLPGIVAALSFRHSLATRTVLVNTIMGLVAIGLVASSNYVLNEIMDAPFDRFHPVKCNRPVPSGQVSIPLAYAEWIVLAMVGLFVAQTVSPMFTLSLVALWLMGCVYNVPPVRSKDVPYLDVLTEALNNPIRLLAGWFIVTSSMIVPGSLLLSYWMVGCYFMGLKRYAEYLRFKSDGGLARYRRSLAHFSAEGLLVSVMFYGSSSMLFFGAFLMRYRMELVLSFPMIALVMAIYLSLAFKHDSAVEHPEKLYREPRLMLAVAACVIVMTVCLLVDMPRLYRIFEPTAPVSSAYPVRR